MTATKKMIYVAICLGFASGCQHTSQDLSRAIVAKVGSQEITVSDVDTYLLSLPESQRWRPDGVDFSVWIEGKIRMLALQNHLAASDKMRQLMTQPETRLRRQLMRTQLLRSTLLRELATEIEPSKEEIAERAEKMAERHGSQPLLSFQHIYFRTDKGQDLKTVRASAEKVAAEAKQGGDFTALVRAYSDSANAVDGGIVQNVRAIDLDKTTREALEALDEGDVGEVIETRSGLHIFRLVRRFKPRPPPPSQLTNSARSVLMKEQFGAKQKELLDELYQRIEIRTESEPWQVGSFSAEADFRKQVIASNRQQGIAAADPIVDLLLMAQEALDRGLGTEALERQVEESLRMGFLELLINERRRKLDSELPAERLRTFYDAEPTLFATPEQARLNLIFVPQGKDSLATQRRLEAHVADLRAGASFAALARKISKGPGAENGGDLGLLKPNAWSNLGPKIASAVAELEVGEISDPIYCTGRVVTKNPYFLRGGFAILEVTERVPERPRSFEEAIHDIRLAYASRHRSELDAELHDLILVSAGFEIKRLPLPEELAQ